MRSDHGSENVDSHFSSCNAMKKEVIYSSGMSVTSHKTARCQKPETYSAFSCILLQHVHLYIIKQLPLPIYKQELHDSPPTAT